jgi:hypothetical protein
METTQLKTMETIKHQIFAFINAGKGTDWNVVVALADDGRCLASHVSSCEGWAQHDVGLGSTWKHDLYNEAFPDGWELIWVDDPNNHEGVNKACALNQALQKQSV